MFFGYSNPALVVQSEEENKFMFIMSLKRWVKFSLSIHCLQVSEQETTLTYINFLQDY